MYLRFALGRLDPWSGAPMGFFRVAYALQRDERVPDWLQDALREETDWFDRHLGLPDRCWRGDRARRGETGICWFRPQARDHIAHAYALRSLIEEAGVAVGRLQTRDPGDVVWQDSHQIVAKPVHTTRVAW